MGAQAADHGNAAAAQAIHQAAGAVAAPRGIASGYIVAGAYASWSASPLEAYGPDDFAALAADESKRDVFMAAYRHSIVPRMRTAADLLMTKRHLLDYPSPTYLDGLFAASGIDWNKFLCGTIAVPPSGTRSTPTPGCRS